MSKKKCHVVGCGTIGANLSIRLLHSNLFDEVHIYDDDVVSNHKYIFPFSKTDYLNKKVLALENLWRIKKEKLRLRGIETPELYVYDKKIYKKIRNGFVIDCRDNKEINIFSDIKLSMDANVLFIDCRRSANKGSDIYYNRPEACIVGEAIKSVVEFLKDKKYSNKNLYMIDFSNTNGLVKIGD